MTGALYRVVGPRFVAGFVINGETGNVTACAPILRRRGGTLAAQRRALRPGETVTRIGAWRRA